MQLGCNRVYCSKMLSFGLDLQNTVKELQYPLLLERGREEWSKGEADAKGEYLSSAKTLRETVKENSQEILKEE